MENLHRALEKIVGKENVKDDIVELLCYSSDMSPFTYKPNFIVLPKTTDEVSKILRLANAHRIPVTPRGAGTSVVGAILPRKGGIILDLTKMDKIKELKVEDLYVVVEPGVVLDKLNKTLSKHGLFFPPDPGSSLACTVGGMAATNASGVRAVKYGTTRDWVLGLEVVLANGEIFKTGKPVLKTSSGYNLVQLFVGSEGTLGVITELTLKVHPIPSYKATVSVYFDQLENAGRAVTDILLAGVKPAAMELMDKTCINVINQAFNLNLPETEGLVIIELDGNMQGVKQDIETIEKICMQRGGREIEWTDDPRRSERLWSARKVLVPSLARLKEGNIIVVLAEDPGLPISEMEEAIKEFQKISKKYGIIIATFGHTGDGNIHPLMIINPDNPEEWKKVWQIEKELIVTVLKRKGTLTAEHGIGLSKIPFASPGLGISLEIMKKIKKTLDPNNILNPGKMGLDTDIRKDPDNLFYQKLRKVKMELFLARFRNDIIKCFKCGLCRAVCPTFNGTKMESANARGKVLLAYFLLTGQLEPSEKVLEAFNKCTLCAHCTLTCPPGIRVAEIVEHARRDLADRGFIHPLHKAMADNIIKHGNPFGKDAVSRDELAKSLETISDD
jgi:glycolate oxidase